MVGGQGSGKSTWVAEHLAGTHVVVSKDHWPRARRREVRQRRHVAAALAGGRPVVVDNTNPTPQDRAALVTLGHAAGARVRAVHVDVPLEVCLDRNERRPPASRVPLVGMLATRARLVAPTLAEGFDEVEVVRGGGGPPAVGQPAPGPAGPLTGPDVGTR